MVGIFLFLIETLTSSWGHMQRIDGQIQAHEGLVDRGSQGSAALEGRCEGGTSITLFMTYSARIPARFICRRKRPLLLVLSQE